MNWDKIIIDWWPLVASASGFAIGMAVDSFEEGMTVAIIMGLWVAIINHIIFKRNKEMWK